VNQNDFDKALKRIDAETSDYYMLGYYSSNPDPLKRTRKVEVKSKKGNVNVWARSSYTMKQPPRSKRAQPTRTGSDVIDGARRQVLPRRGVAPRADGAGCRLPRAPRASMRIL
jgi:hypothetical protein